MNILPQPPFYHFRSQRLLAMQHNMAFAYNRNNMTAVQQMFPTGGVQAYANSAGLHPRPEKMLAWDVGAKLGGFDMLKAMGGLHGASLAGFDMLMAKLGIRGMQLRELGLPKAKLGLNSRVSFSCESAEEDEELADDDPYPVVGPSPSPGPVSFILSPWPSWFNFLEGYYYTNSRQSTGLELLAYLRETPSHEALPVHPYIPRIWCRNVGDWRQAWKAGFLLDGRVVSTCVKGWKAYEEEVPQLSHCVFSRRFLET
ncbi:uncharacterized protein PAC_04095 [Phialocephala subalpina]|uniref:Uncharacterized protein n=1 Tax=Phialocephala subalpina TaxID=576137 RepID=A0A1L7WN80_9HELO|nr:uncharacterized protein PAC_04095 [Phialocephala subalpina]